MLSATLCGQGHLRKLLGLKEPHAQIDPWFTNRLFFFQLCQAPSPGESMGHLQTPFRIEIQFSPPNREVYKTTIIPLISDCKIGLIPIFQQNLTQKSFLTLLVKHFTAFLFTLFFQGICTCLRKQITIAGLKTSETCCLCSDLFIYKNTHPTPPLLLQLCLLAQFQHEG